MPLLDTKPFGKFRFAPKCYLHSAARVTFQGYKVASRNKTIGCVNHSKNTTAVKTFRLPRKTKKSLKGKLWLYPADGDGSSVMAFPRRSQEDYTALKKGAVKDLMNTDEARARGKEMKEILDKETVVSDEELKRYVDNIIREDLRRSSYNTLIAAKNNPKAISAYYDFVNAYQVYQADGSYGNICCLAIDKAKDLLKKYPKY